MHLIRKRGSPTNNQMPCRRCGRGGGNMRGWRKFDAVSESGLWFWYQWSSSGFVRHLWHGCHGCECGSRLGLILYRPLHSQMAEEELELSESQSWQYQENDCGSWLNTLVSHYYFACKCKKSWYRASIMTILSMYLKSSIWMFPALHWSITERTASRACSNCWSWVWVLAVVRRYWSKGEPGNGLRSSRYHDFPVSEAPGGNTSCGWVWCGDDVADPSQPHFIIQLDDGDVMVKNSLTAAVGDSRSSWKRMSSSGGNQGHTIPYGWVSRWWSECENISFIFFIKNILDRKYRCLNLTCYL